MPHRVTLSAVACLIATAVCCANASDDPNAAPIHYDTAPVDDAVARLQRALDAGEAELSWDERLGWLPSVLEALGVSDQSQLLVFSKTSLQTAKISPHRPRAVYFNDDTYVGYVQRGDLIELSAVDPRQGTIFYSLPQEEADAPRFVREQGRCLVCHDNGRTRDVPGLLVRSVYPDDRGHALLSLGDETTDPTTPLEQRYGGWYVTGEAGVAHRGNAVYTEPDSADEPEPIAVSLGKTCSPDRYLTPHSDLVALMVLEHQSQMHNAITRASYEARRAAAYDTMWNEILEKPEGHVFAVSERRIERAVEQLLECLLFSGEAALPGAVSGTSGFAAKFEAAGHRDGQGRSLRDFDLQTRLFKHPCSYLIHSEAFAALPEPVLELVEERLGEILTGEDASPAFAHLTPADHRAISEILSATKSPVGRLLAHE
ncbi:hypothetical protein MalM25_01370 [Planctomycetes bacterium MalM25]|nr:hypothetical protein MalM25_01370 [Planctomycetes bacterium MalM25]